MGILLFVLGLLLIYLICLICFVVGIMLYARIFLKYHPSEAEPKHQNEIIIENVINIVQTQYKQISKGFYWGDAKKYPDVSIIYVFKTDKELNNAQNNGKTEEINNFHKIKMSELGYPENAIRDCIFYSQEDCNKKTDGNWYYYDKL